MLYNTAENINLASLTFWSNNWGVLYTVVENQSGGTDHGHAGLSLLAGGDLKAFKDYRKLQEPEFEIERGEVFLKYGVDFRDLISQVTKFID
jgi:hypothetical protein